MFEQSIEIRTLSKDIFIEEVLMFPTWLAQRQVKRFDEQLIIGLQETLDSTVPLERNTPEVLFAPGFVLKADWYSRLMFPVPGWYTAPRSMINLRRNPGGLPLRLRQQMVRQIFAVLDSDIRQAIPYKVDHRWEALKNFPVLCELLLLAGEGYGIERFEVREVMRHANTIKGWR